MNKIMFSSFLILFVIFLLNDEQVFARPHHHFNSRVKRVSEAHLQDIQTKNALHRFGVAITLPVAPGTDFMKIGRKRRSESRLLEALFNQSEEDQDDPTEEFNELQFVYA